MELDLDVSVQNESYEQLLTSLGETITALVRQQLTKFSGYSGFYSTQQYTHKCSCDVARGAIHQLCLGTWLLCLPDTQCQLVSDG